MNHVLLGTVLVGLWGYSTGTNSKQTLYEENIKKLLSKVIDDKDDKTTLQNKILSMQKQKPTILSAPLNKFQSYALKKMNLKPTKPEEITKQALEYNAKNPVSKFFASFTTHRTVRETAKELEKMGITNENLSLHQKERSADDDHNVGTPTRKQQIIEKQKEDELARSEIQSIFFGSSHGTPLENGLNSPPPQSTTKQQNQPSQAITERSSSAPAQKNETLGAARSISAPPAASNLLASGYAVQKPASEKKKIEEQKEQEKAQEKLENTLMPQEPELIEEIQQQKNVVEKDLKKIQGTETEVKNSHHPKIKRSKSTGPTLQNPFELLDNIKLKMKKKLKKARKTIEQKQEKINSEVAKIVAEVAAKEKQAQQRGELPSQSGVYSSENISDKEKQEDNPFLTFDSFWLDEGSKQQTIEQIKNNLRSQEMPESEIAIFQDEYNLQQALEKMRAGELNAESQANVIIAELMGKFNVSSNRNTAKKILNIFVKSGINTQEKADAILSAKFPTESNDPTPKRKDPLLKRSVSATPTPRNKQETSNNHESPSSQVRLLNS